MKWKDVGLIRIIAEELLKDSSLRNVKLQELYEKTLSLFFLNCIIKIKVMSFWQILNST